MDKQTFFESLSGLFAYDTGCVDSGIKNESLKTQVFGEIERMNEDEFRLTFSEYIRSYYISEEAVSQGYGIEDVAEFLRWLSRNGIDL